MKKKTKKTSQPDPFRAQLSVVIPTRNERDNVAALFAALGAALAGIATEVVLVDDSDDDTPALARALGAQMASPQFRVQVLHRARGTARIGGLATAVDAGLRRATAPYVAVIDADLQHPPERLRVLYESAHANDADIVLATRYQGDGSYEGLDGPGRKIISVGLKWVAKLAFPEKLLRVSDPLGGFFLVRRSLLAGITLRPIGYKISLEILLRCPWQTCVE
ncbi:MAG: glycosyltransferase, partial [Ktedonobacterales bacterium]|nr:glycosyltransferase [Ktedonobacterales bacterium]